MSYEEFLLFPDGVPVVIEGEEIFIGDKPDVDALVRLAVRADKEIKGCILEAKKSPVLAVKMAHLMRLVDCAKNMAAIAYSASALLQGGMGASDLAHKMGVFPLLIDSSAKVCVLPDSNGMPLFDIPRARLIALVLDELEAAISCVEVVEDGEGGDIESSRAACNHIMFATLFARQIFTNITEEDQSEPN